MIYLSAASAPSKINNTMEDKMKIEITYCSR